MLLFLAFISIFLQCEVMPFQQPWLNNRLQDLVDVDLKRHFPIGIAWNIIEDNVRLEIVACRSPAVESLLILCFRLLLMLYTGDTISFSRLANNTELTLCTPPKVYLIAEAYTIPIFWLGMPL